MGYQMNQRGFTLIEILMVIMLVAILAAVSIPQFIDFRTDAKQAATASAVGALRTAIMNQYSQSILRCGVNAGQYPTAAQVSNNDITNGAGPCTLALLNGGAKEFMAGTIPDNPWSGSTAASKNAVTACSGVGCGPTNPAGGKNCAGAAYTTADGGWCYDPATGKIWANSNQSTASTKEFTL